MKTFRELMERTVPVQILHGTDWWTDCDDCVALRLLCRAHKEGVIRLLGVGIDAVMDFSAPSLSAMLTDEGVTVPIGVDFGAYDAGEHCVYQKVLAQYPHKVASNDDCEPACKLYRRLLASCEGKTEITEVGFPQIVMDLLQSPPDEISPLSGMELVRQKVGHIWMMAGRWDTPDGREYNLIHTPRAREAGAYICANSPVPLIFLGFEVGEPVITGGDRLRQGDLLFKAMEAHGSAKGRSSWDPMTVLAAIEQDLDAAGYRAVTGTATVDPATGTNNFTPHSGGNHCYLVKTKPDAWYAEKINALIVSA